MRRSVLACLILLGTTAAFADNPYSLDRNGVLWTAASSQEGLVLTAVLANQTIVRSVIPFEIGLAGTFDSQIQVAADDLTGKVTVVWQRNWTSDLSEIMLAVWNNRTWERILHLSEDLNQNSRNPVIQISQVSDAVLPANGGTPATVSDSFLNVLWWEGVQDQQHASYAILRLTAASDDADALVQQNLDQYTPVGLSCDTPVSPEVLEHPQFAAQSAHDRALMLFGSNHNCLFQLFEVHFVLAPPSQTDGGGMTVTSQRRRHMPIFGVMKSFPMTRDVSMDGARVVLGNNLSPVVYRVVNGNMVEYVTATDTGWSPRRTLAVANGLTLDQAIPLVESLAR